MDLIKEFISTKGTEIINCLAECGFSYEQAKQFIPHASKSILDAIRENDTVTLLNSSKDVRVSTLLGSINIIILASRLDVEVNIAHHGLQKLIPVFLSFSKYRLGSFEDLVFESSDKKSGLTQFIKKLYG